MRNRDIARRYRKALLALTAFYQLLPMRLRRFLLLYAESTKGLRGKVVRYCLVKSIAKSCGDNVLIERGVYLLSPEEMEIGNNVSIHPMCYIEAKGGLVIGNDVSIAHGVTIMTTTHIYDKTDIPIKDQGSVANNVVIKDNVWIGAKATLLCGITVNQGAIVGAGAVVTKTIPANAVVAGVPARIIKMRTQ
jgi:acetyltransferase-like isoleucine patch superfamily enzyme